MINRVGYTDNRTSFGAYWKVDKNGYLDKLHNITTERFGETTLNGIVNLAQDLHYKAPNHELEIVSLIEGTVQRAVVRNNSTGVRAVFETRSGLQDMLPKMLTSLNAMARRNVAFWSEESKNAKLYRLLTGQKEKPIIKI